MELRYLKYFLAVADEMNFNRAARRLHISQPPLSRQIQALERELGTKLLERDGKRFQLTDAGRHFRDGSARILDEVAALERQTRLIGDSGSCLVRIGYVGSMLFSMLPDLLVHLESHMPDVRLDIIELATEQQADAILSGKIDLGFLRSWAETEGVAFESFGEETLSVVYPVSMEKTLAGRSGLVAFAGQPFVAISERAAPRLAELVAMTCAEAGFEPRPRYECSQVSSVVGLVAAGLGWSVVPASAIAKQAAASVMIEPLPTKVTLGLAYKAGALPDRVRAVADAAREYLGRRMAEPPESAATTQEA
jgi:DNA-binding transcriptional LysR family regulator